MKKILILIFALGLFAACQSNTKKAEQSESTTTQVVEYENMEFSVTGMTCTGCENTVVNGLKKLK